MVVDGAHACCRRARARLHGTAQRSPSHAGGEQGGNGQNGQKSDGEAHVFCLEARSIIIAVFHFCNGSKSCGSAPAALRSATEMPRPSKTLAARSGSMWARKVRLGRNALKPQIFNAAASAGAEPCFHALIVGQTFGTGNPFVYGPSLIVPKLTLCATLRFRRKWGLLPSGVIRERSARARPKIR